MLGMLGVMALAACSSPAEPPAPNTQPVAVEDTARDAAPTAPETVDEPAPAAPRACMIAGEFNLMGRVIRSRDCMQITGSSTEADLQRACEGLAQTSAQMGGKAAELTYMDGCPSPSQGSCKNLFGKTFDGFYYERSAEDVAGLPASCALGGGTWVAN